MGNGRWQRLADLLRDAAQGADVGASVARVASDLLGVDDVSLTFVVAGVPTSTVGSSDRAVALCRRQFTLGEGPSVMAMRTGEPSLMADLTADAMATPMLVADPVARDVGAVFAFPLRVGGARVGVMTAHRTVPGPLSPTEHTDALILTTIATVALLQVEAGASLGRVDVAFDPIAEATAALHDDVQIGGDGPPVAARSQVEDLVARWAGFVTVDARIDGRVDALPSAAQDRIAQTVTEAVNNAVRHGRAERVTVEVVADGERTLRLIAEDDGVGPVQRAPGLGSRLFDALSGGAWALAAREDGGSRLEVTVLVD